MANYCLYIPSRASEITTDYNCYWATNGAKLANIGGVECNTIEEMQAAWSLVGKPNNDANSIIADPDFVDFNNEDYTPQSNLVIQGGEPINGIRTTIGAIQVVISSIDLDTLIINKPQIFSSGTLINDDFSETYLSNAQLTENISQDNLEVTNIDTYKLKEGSSIVLASLYPTYDYSLIPEGAIIGKFDENIYSEIRYTINGKTPTRTSHLYTEPITLNDNLSGSDNTLLKYKVFYQGKESETKIIRIKIIKENG